MGAMMERASWSFWRIKDFKKAGIQGSCLSPLSLTITDLQGFDFVLLRRRFFTPISSSSNCDGATEVITREDIFPAERAVVQHAVSETRAAAMEVEPRSPTPAIEALAADLLNSPHDQRDRSHSAAQEQDRQTARRPPYVS